MGIMEQYLADRGVESWEQLEVKWKHRETEIRNRDRRSRQTRKRVGRIMRWPFADGEAVYTIQRVSDDYDETTGNGFAFLKHEDLYDGWTYPLVEDMDRKLPAALVKKHLDRADAFAKLFGGDDETAMNP